MSETEERTFTLGRRRRRRVSLALWVAEGSGRIRSTLEKPVACCPTNTNESLWVAWSWERRELESTGGGWQSGLCCLLAGITWESGTGYVVRLVLDTDGVTTAPIFELFRFGRVLFLSMGR